MNRGYTYLWRKIWANSLLVNYGKKFSRLEAWLYLTNVLAAGMENEAAGLKRGQFAASSRFLAQQWNWPRSQVQRFLKELEMEKMICRIKDPIRAENPFNSGLGHLAGHQAGRRKGHFIICNYDTYNPIRAVSQATDRAAKGATYNKRSKNEVKIKDTHVSAAADAPVSPKILLEIYRQHNQSLPEVKALTAERLKKCQSRINQAIRDGCLEPYLADFTAAVKKAQSTPFLRGEGARGWRASFDWFVANQANIYAVLEGKYDGPAAGSNNKNGGFHASSCDHFDCDPGGTSSRRTSHGDPIYHPRQ